MENGQLTWIVNFISGIADEVLKDLYVRTKYRDVILPMAVIRRLDAVLEPTKQEVLAMKARLDKAGIVDQDAALRKAAGQAFYNTSEFTLRDLGASANRQGLENDFTAYLDGFSPNVQEIIDSLGFRTHIPRLAKAGALDGLIEKFLDPSINLSPYPVLNSEGSVRLPGLDNHAMGTIFEALVRRFSEEDIKETGEYWTPRDAVRLMARLIFEPIADHITDGTYLLYDGACGTGGMLTVAEETLLALASQRGKQLSVHLFGQEINPETCAICKADLLLKGEGDAIGNIVGGPGQSTLSNDAFPGREFDFMLSNPPYGRSWEADLARMGGKNGVRDPRFIVQHRGEKLSLIPPTSDGQMLFLANMLSKMKHGTPLGSRIAELHSGSSLFRGVAGLGESNIRRWIIENDWLEAIVALPFNMFYNTDIATYVWLLTNRKPEHRKGRVQLIDATQWYTPLRKNLGKKNRELSEEDIRRIVETFLRFEETGCSKILPNAAFGYWRVTVERPLRLKGIDPGRAYTPGQIRSLREEGERAEDGPPVIKRIHRRGTAPDPLRGLFEVTIRGKDGTTSSQLSLFEASIQDGPRVVEYEPDPDLRDSEQIPFLESPACHEPGYLPGPDDQRTAVETFLRREVLPYAPDAWYDPASVKVGYEINFNQYFYTPKALRSLDEIRSDILVAAKEADESLRELLGGSA